MKKYPILLCTLLVLAALLSSCSLLMNEVFFDLKDKNLYTGMEDIPLYSMSELEASLDPYGTITNGLIDFDGTGNRIYTMSTAFNDTGIVIASFSIVDDLYAYVENVEKMVGANTLKLFVDNGGQLLVVRDNLLAISTEISSLQTKLNTIGFTSTSVADSVNDALDALTLRILEAVIVLEQEAN